MKIEGACHPVISVCPFKGALAPSVHASLNCYNFFVTQAIYIKVYIFLKPSV